MLYMEDLDPNHRIVKAIHRVLIPNELNCVCEVSNDTLEVIGHRKLTFDHVDEFCVVHEKTFDRTSKLYVYGTPYMIKHLIGKKGATMLKTRARLGLRVFSVNPLDKAIPALSNEQLMLDKSNRITIGKDNLKILPINVLCDVYSLVSLIKRCLELKNTDTMFYKLAMNAKNALIEFGGISGIKASIKLCKMLDDYGMNIGQDIGIDLNLGYVYSIFELHWSRISNQPYPIDFNDIDTTNIIYKMK